MEAKDTVMSEEQIKMAWYSQLGHVAGDKAIAQAQAEISFKAGIKEVVEWGLETCPHDLFGEGTQCYKRACDKCWQEKWGNLAPHQG